MGALTLKVFADELREWELIESEGIDPTDSFGVNLRLSVRENQIFLAEPFDADMPWITDRGRLFFDGMFSKEKLETMNWENFFSKVSDYMYFIDHLNLITKNPFKFVICFENVSLETLNILYTLEQTCSLVKLKKSEKHIVKNDLESSYLLNDTVEKSKLKLSNVGLLLNTNPRYEGYVLNLNLRQRFLKGDFKLFSIGSLLDLSIPTYNLGSNTKILKSIGEGTHISCQDFKNSEYPLLISNTEFFKRQDSKILFEIFKYSNIVTSIWNGLNILNHSLSASGINSINKFLPLSNEDFLNFFGLYFVNSSLSSSSNIKKITEFQLLEGLNFNNNLNKTFFLNQNNINDNFIYEKVKLKLKFYDNYFYLPSNLFLEDSETYINTQGIIKRTNKLLDFKKNSKSNWQIIRKIFNNSKKVVFLNNKKDNELITFDCKQLFNYKNFINFNFYASKSLTALSFYLNKSSKLINNNNSIYLKQTKVKFYNTKIKNWLDDFFVGHGNDSFTFNSSLMVDCSKIVRGNSTNFF